MKAKQLDQLFDSATTDMTPYLDISKAYRGDQHAASQHTVQRSAQPQQTRSDTWQHYPHNNQAAFA